MYITFFRLETKIFKALPVCPERKNMMRVGLDYFHVASLNHSMEDAENYCQSRGMVLAPVNTWLSYNLAREATKGTFSINTICLANHIKPELFPFKPLHLEPG